MEQPKPTDIEWSDYVLSQFHEGELDRGYPKVDGLRRVVEVVMGEIVSAEIKQLDSPNEQNNFRATCVYSVTIKLPSSEKDSFLPNLRIYQDAADAGAHNIKQSSTGIDFTNYATTIAVTRAEARALRKALKLKVMAAEESMEIKTELPMSSSQASAINLICNRHNLNAEDVFNKYTTQFGLSNKKQLSFAQAVKIINELNTGEKA